MLKSSLLSLPVVVHIHQHDNTRSFHGRGSQALLFITFLCYGVSVCLYVVVVAYLQQEMQMCSSCYSAVLFSCALLCGMPSIVYTDDHRCSRNRSRPACLTDVRRCWSLGKRASGTSPVPLGHAPLWVFFHVRDSWVSRGWPFMKLGQSEQIYHGYYLRRS